MKKLFFCCFISFLISGCISKKIDSRISINNNYNAIFQSQDGNIISISDKDSGTLASLYYNELGQLIKINDINRLCCINI